MYCRENGLSIFLPIFIFLSIFVGSTVFSLSLYTFNLAGTSYISLVAIWQGSLIIDRVQLNRNKTFSVYKDEGESIVLCDP